MKLLREIIYGVSILEIKGNTNIAIESWHLILGMFRIYRFLLPLLALNLMVMILFQMQKTLVLQL